jgi:CDP-diacylglycerol---glycerol-3-phosphate 3-phosphatidyltransferase
VTDSTAVRPSNWNVPNAITVVRILLTPVFIWLLLTADPDSAARWAAGLFFILAIATDGIDGWIARRWNLVTDLGKILDPIADKGLTGSALVCLAILGELPWWVVVLILVREIGITIWRLFELRLGRVVPASRGGKLKTVAQSVAISLALLPLWTVFGDWVHWLNGVTMTIAVLLTVMTGVDYLVQGRRHNRKEA